MNRIIRNLAEVIDEKVLHGQYVDRLKFIRNINCYHKKNQKRVLVSYTNANFYIEKEKISHSNTLEMNELLKFFINKDFCIDVVDCLYNNFTYRTGTYDIVFGQGIPFVKSKEDKNVKRIGYLTEAYPGVSSILEKERMNYYFERHKYKKNASKVFIRPNTFHYINDDLLYISDYLICLGNKWTISTYPKDIREKIINFFPTAIINENFSFDTKMSYKNTLKDDKRIFIWFGSQGSGHKGLDIVLDAFAELDLNNVELWIFGLNKKEYKFFKTYFHNNNNIKNFGTIKVKNDDFLEVAKQGDFVILPSCSEGMSTSVLTCMAHGCVPIITKEAGVDIIEDSGFILKDYRVETVKNIIKKVTKISKNTLLKMQEKNYYYAGNKFSLENFYKEFSEIMNKILEK